MFSYFLALSTIPMQTASWVASLEVSSTVILAVIILIYLFLGCFLDAISMMVLTMPVIFPIIEALHFHPIWFGVIAVLMMEAGLITPAHGAEHLHRGGVAKDVPVETDLPGSGSVFVRDHRRVVLITIFPQMALFLPKMMLRARGEGDCCLPRELYYSVVAYGCCCGKVLFSFLMIRIHFLT